MLHLGHFGFEGSNRRWKATQAASSSRQRSLLSRLIQPVALQCFGQTGKTAPDAITISDPQQLLIYIPNWSARSPVLGIVITHWQKVRRLFSKHYDDQSGIL
jgi:hypothetical protein